MSDLPLLDRILQLFAERGILTSAAEIARFREAFGGQAFFLTGEWREKVLEKVKALIATALEEGWTSAEFKAAASEVLSRFNDGSYADIVFKTNVANARTTGAFEEMFSPEWVDEAPYWEFRADVDSHNDEESECPDLRCRWLNGRTFRKSDTAAQAFIPILHFGCRCGMVERTEDSRRSPVTDGAEIPFSPLPGWGGGRFSSLFSALSGGV